MVVVDGQFFGHFSWKVEVTVCIHINWGNYCVERFY